MYPNTLTPDSKMHPSERRHHTVRQMRAIATWMAANGRTDRQGKSKAGASWVKNPIISG